MSIFSKRHYEVVAVIFKDARQWNGDEAIDLPERKLKQIDRLEQMFIRYFQRDNPNFKPETFYRASRKKGD